MVALIQRTTGASVEIEDSVHASIGRGLVVLLGITHDDTNDDVDWLVNKVVQLRIFNDDQGVMNRSCEEIGGEVLVVSQFTLQASTRKGNRPSYIQAAGPDIAIPLYEQFLARMASRVPTKSGVFGADMNIQLVNNGPVTIHIDSKHKK